MAVDTEAKRFRAMYFGHIGGGLPLPSGTVDASERAAFLALYLAGGERITYTKSVRTATVVAEDRTTTVVAEDRTTTVVAEDRTAAVPSGN